MNSKNLEFNYYLLSAIEDFKKERITDYDSFIVTDPDHVLVRFLKFVPPIKGTIIVGEFSIGTGAIGSKSLQRGTGFENEKTGLELINSRLTPICKVIKSGSDKYKEGDIIVLPDEKVSGEIDNPAWQLYEQSLNSKGVEAIPPEDNRKKIPMMEVMWQSYIFKRPWMYTPEEEDRLTFLLPIYELKVGWDLDGYLKQFKK
jgi:hypothetical protein